MKYCPECGTKILSDSKYCTNCGTNLSRSMQGDSASRSSGDQEDTASFNQAKYQYYGAEKQDEVASMESEMRTTHKKLVNDPAFSTLAFSSLFFAFAPIINFVLAMILEESSIGDLVGDIINVAAIGALVYGIYSFSSLENRANNPGKKAITFFSIHIVATILLNFFLASMGDIDQIPQSQYQSFLSLFIIFTFVLIIVDIIGYIGATSFTEWIEQLSFSYNAPSTDRFKWFFGVKTGSSALVFLAMLQLQSAVNNNSYEQLENATALIGLGAIVLLVALVIQFLAGYKLYKILQDVKAGKYSGNYSPYRY